jgi:hypothetical protein
MTLFMVESIPLFARKPLLIAMQKSTHHLLLTQPEVKRQPNITPPRVTVFHYDARSRH